MAKHAIDLCYHLCIIVHTKPIFKYAMYIAECIIYFLLPYDQGLNLGSSVHSLSL